jgi:hypothetical protein
MGRIRSVSGEENVYGARLKGTVTVGPITLHDPEVIFAKGDIANVGMPIARQLTVVLDPEEQRTWVLRPNALTNAELARYAGQFDGRSIQVGKNRLIYQRAGRVPVALKYLGEDLFENEQTGDRIQFWRGAGRTAGLDFITVDGQVISIRRTG